MQDRYAGDLGDFLKLGLLRWLVGMQLPDGPDLRLGIVWYRTPDESHNADGKHVAYLDDDHPAGRRLAAMDSDLHARLASMVLAGDRSVAGIERCGALPPGTRTFGDSLTFADLPPTARAARADRRARWVSDAFGATDGCDVVFADPDNGLRPSDHPIARTRKGSEKQAYADELRPFIERQQSIVVYHHADRSAPVPEQAKRRLQMLASEFPVPPLAAVRASRGTTRLFLVCPAPAHARAITDRLLALQDSPWRKELRPTWFRSDLPAW